MKMANAVPVGAPSAGVEAIATKIPFVTPPGDPGWRIDRTGPLCRLPSAVVRHRLSAGRGGPTWAALRRAGTTRRRLLPRGRAAATGRAIATRCGGGRDLADPPHQVVL
jgi:hypothetical protein